MLSLTHFEQVRFLQRKRRLGSGAPQRGQAVAPSLIKLALDVLGGFAAIT
jgi:hypothetical protein